MKYRKLDKDGDYQIGHGNLDFFQDVPEAVGQLVMTRLKLWRGQWFIDTEEGTPWLQQILGKRMAVEAAVRARVLGTQGVTEITEFTMQINPDTRQVLVDCTIDTVYGSTSISGDIAS